MDEAKKEEIRKWLIKAERDIGSAEKLLSGENSFPDTAVYHCQQAAEKALKAYLTLKDIPFQKVHDLTALVYACAETDRAFEQIRVAGEILTPYAVAFRYPADILEPYPEDAGDAVRLAKEVIAFIRERMPDEI